MEWDGKRLYNRGMASQTVTLRRTYKYRLYRNDRRDQALHQQINIAGKIWNHALALQRRHYRLFGGFITHKRMKAHVAKLRRRVKRYAYWQGLGSQAVQEVIERQDEAWQRFFAQKGNLPRFKKVNRYKSFTLKQTTGWKLLAYNQNQPHGKDPRGQDQYRRARGVVEIQGISYKFIQHRPLFGTVKTVTIKRDACGQLWVCFSVVEEQMLPEQADLSHIGGFDFGLRHFLTDHTGKRYMHPLFLHDVLHRVRQLNRSLSRKVEGSHNRERTRWLLGRTHMRVADQRRDFHFKLANALCDSFDVLVIEDLHIAAMQRLWGRKVSDLGFTKFVAILQHIALKRGKLMVRIDRFEPTTVRCSRCGKRQAMSLQQRTFVCPRCGLSLDRDHNAALNIQRAGASALGLGIISPTSVGSPA